MSAARWKGAHTHLVLSSLSGARAAVKRRRIENDIAAEGREPALQPRPVVAPPPDPPPPQAAPEAAPVAAPVAAPEAAPPVVEPAPPKYVNVTAFEYGPQTTAAVACSPTARQTVLQWMRSRVRRDAAESRTVLVLQGPSGCGKRALVRAAAAECGCTCVEGTEVPGMSLLEGVANVCERVLNARPLGGHPPNVFLFGGVDGMISKGSSSGGGASAGAGAGSASAGAPSLDARLLARVLNATSAARSAPLVLTVCDFGTDELRQLRKDPRVCFVTLGPAEVAAATRALGTLAARQHWPPSAVTSALAVFHGDIRALLIHAQEAALGFVAVHAAGEPQSSGGNQFDVARSILNAGAVHFDTLAFRCAAGFVDGLAQHCVFSSQFASLGLADAPMSMWHGMCAVSDAWSWYDACVPWNSDMRDALLVLPIAAVQQLRCAARTPLFNGRLLDDEGGGNGGAGHRRKLTSGSLHVFQERSDAWRLRGAAALHHAEALTHCCDASTRQLRAAWKPLMSAKVSETPSARALALQSEPRSTAVALSPARRASARAPALPLPAVSSREWW
jgi:hypothetical protein